jgi:hypothetical protein
LPNPICMITRLRDDQFSYVSIRGRSAKSAACFAEALHQCPVLCHLTSFLTGLRVKLTSGVLVKPERLTLFFFL